jgi:hypothetical protein
VQAAHRRVRASWKAVSDAIGGRSAPRSPAPEPSRPRASPKAADRQGRLSR